MRASFAAGTRTCCPAGSCCTTCTRFSLEHLVGLELRRREGTIWPDARLHHFRTSRGAGVDFVLSVGRELWGIEVNASRHVDARELEGLQAFAQIARGVARRIIVFLGARRQRIENVEALPLEELLAELPG